MTLLNDGKVVCWVGKIINNTIFLLIFKDKLNYLKIPKKLKVLYLENNSKDKNLDNFQDFTMYEYEYLLPRNLEFIEYKTKNIK